MKQYIKPTISCLEITPEHMIAATIQINNKDAEDDACSKETTFRYNDFTLWEEKYDDEDEDEYEY